MVLESKKEKITQQILASEVQRERGGARRFPLTNLFKCILSFALIVGCTLVSPAHAAGFDCEKSGSSVEKTICADADLSRQDGLLREAYKDLLKASPDPEALKSEQRKWQSRRNLCTEDMRNYTGCLSLYYYARRGHLATELMMKSEKGNLQEGTKNAYPDMWLMQTVFPIQRIEGGHILLFRLDRQVQKKLGMRGDIDDYFYVDYMPGDLHGKYILRGFFSGQFAFVHPLDPMETAYELNGIVLDQSRAEKPLPISTDYDAEGVALSDNTLLRMKPYPQWKYGSQSIDPCERAVWALERVNAGGTVIWSRNYIIKSGLSWHQLCRTAGSTLQPVLQYETVVRAVEYSWDDEFGSQDIFSLQDGTVLVATKTHLLRVRLSDGESGRLGQGAVSASSAEMIAFKEKFKRNWPSKRDDAYTKYWNCIGRNRTIKEHEILSVTKCKTEADNPFRDQARWYLALNSEIAATFLSAPKK